MAGAYEHPTVNDADANGNEMPQPANAAPSADPAPRASVTVRFCDQHGSDIQFKMKQTTRLSKAMDAFCDRVQREKRSLRFLFEGQRIIDTHTPQELEMEGDAMVEVHEEQIGGSANFALM